MPQRLRSFLADTDIFIDYLNGVESTREVLDSRGHRVYYARITRKELLAVPGLSARERRLILALLAKHRLIPLDEMIAERFSRLLAKYGSRGLRNADALVAATAWSRRLPLLTRNAKHYRSISEIALIQPAEL